MLLREQLGGEKAHSYFGRALHELGIEWIAAHSPQAKGRIERLFETLQDRLVKEMRLTGIDSLAAANHLRRTFFRQWEERFSVVPRKPRAMRIDGRMEDSAWRKSPACGGRTVADDHTVSCRKSLGRATRRSPRGLGSRWKSSDD